MALPSRDLALLSSRIRHKHVSLWLNVHALLVDHKNARILLQNVFYFTVMRSRRLKGQLDKLDQSLALGGRARKAFARLLDTDTPWRQIVIDCHPCSEDVIAVRDDIFSEPCGLWR